MADIVWYKLVAFEFPSFSTRGLKGTEPVPLFCRFAENGTDVAKAELLLLLLVAPKPLPPEPNSPPDPLPKVGLLAEPNVLVLVFVLAEFPNEVLADPKPPKALLLVAVPLPNRLVPLVVVEPKAGLFCPNGDVLLLEPNPVNIND